MPTRRDRTLKVIKGSRSGAAGRPAQRRVVLRSVRTPIEDVLERIDQEPAEDAAVGGVPTGPADPERVEDRLEAADAPGDDPAAAGDLAPASAGPGRRRLLVGLLVALLAGSLALAGLYGHRWYGHRALEEARQGALAAAKQTSVDFVSVSAASVDRDLQRIVDGATGEFKDEFTRGQAQVRTAVVENKVESRGSVLRAGLVTGDRRRAVVLVAVDATVKNAKAPAGRAAHYRIQLDLVHDRGSGQWLVSRLQFVG
ncbi:hypothetical protein ACN26Y_19685 [Micromonospora sp. WMMD558]|uniref:hypothetical protein n=1 Tax=unclassified Micromonospora TaxID=2617518 RepID=UPI0012B46DA8|nr:hypothetical protein [Micromonospora sp. WMMC415]QGN48294.1 hypothetical protein GKC29_16590 [Micromonospora sp. WMMC415]